MSKKNYTFTVNGEDKTNLAKIYMNQVKKRFSTDFKIYHGKEATEMISVIYAALAINNLVTLESFGSWLWNEATERKISELYSILELDKNKDEFFKEFVQYAA